jgi:hypothetical protein
LFNLGHKEVANKVLEEIKDGGYVLSDEEKNYNFEKIKALKDPNDDMRSKKVPFEDQDEGAPKVIDQIKIHESWLALADEHLKWGNYSKAKNLVQEINTHARILKD